jgi:hypothetical protein
LRNLIFKDEELFGRLVGSKNEFFFVFVIESVFGRLILSKGSFLFCGVLNIPKEQDFEKNLL